MNLRGPFCISTPLIAHIVYPLSITALALNLLYPAFSLPQNVVGNYSRGTKLVYVKPRGSSM